MTNDSYLFKTTPGNGRIPLYGGKMIHQFTNLYASPKYWIIEKDGRRALLGGKKDTGQVLDYQCYRLGFRDIARNTDTRTCIATITPKVFHGNKLPQTLIFQDEKRIIENIDLVYLSAFFNSFILDFHIRNRVTTTLNFHFVYNTPVPRLKSNNIWYKPIVERVAKLICTTEDFAELWECTMKTKWGKEVGATDEAERGKLRAELDGIIAHIYGLSEEEFTYILATFPLVADEQKQAALEYFKKIAPKFSVDQVDWKSIIDTGENPKLEFKSTLRINIVAGNIVDKKMERMAMKTIAGYLNTDGGTLLIGVDDKKNVLGLDLDFSSFQKGHDLLDEFQKNLDALIQNSLGNRFHRYLDISYPEVDGKTICAIVIKEKSSEPVYYTDENKQEIFYIRRQASTIDLKPSEAHRYIKDHWK
jgi:hypothetical protein